MCLEVSYFSNWSRGFLLYEFDCANFSFTKYGYITLSSAHSPLAPQGRVLACPITLVCAQPGSVCLLGYSSCAAEILPPSIFIKGRYSSLTAHGREDLGAGLWGYMTLGPE